MPSTAATPHPTPRDHGGNMAEAVARYGGRVENWLDLSTGINPHAYPLAPIAPRAYQVLPDAGRLAALCAVARKTYGAAGGDILAAPGAQALIELLPAYLSRLPVTIASPTYNEHAAAFHAHGFEVVEQAAPTGPIRVIVNPNNPDGRVWSRDEVQGWLDKGVFVIVDESFADPTPETSLASLSGHPRLIILRSFGKFFGLAGLRLGFALGPVGVIEPLRRALGLWAVSGPAIEAGIQGLSDTDWQADMRGQLVGARDRLSHQLRSIGCEIIGQTHLFVTIRHPQAAALHAHLAQHQIWTRAFPYAKDWLRFGLPGAGAERLFSKFQSFNPEK